MWHRSVLDPTSEPPPALIGHSMTLHRSSRTLYVFGGYKREEIVEDNQQLICSRPITHPGEGQSHPHREDQSKAWLHSSEEPSDGFCRVPLSRHKVTCDLLLFHLKECLWEKISPQHSVGSSFPTARSNHAAAWIDSGLFIHGGLSADGSTLASAHVFCPSSKLWTTQFIFGEPIAPRYGHSLAYHNGDLFAFFGTTSDGVELDEVCVFHQEKDPGTWEVTRYNGRSGAYATDETSFYSFSASFLATKRHDESPARRRLHADSPLEQNGYMNSPMSACSLAFGEWPPPRAFQCVTSSFEIVYVFGGRGHLGFLDDLWCFDMNTLIWKVYSRDSKTELYVNRKKRYEKTRLRDILQQSRSRKSPDANDLINEDKFDFIDSIEDSSSSSSSMDSSDDDFEDDEILSSSSRNRPCAREKGTLVRNGDDLFLFGGWSANGPCNDLWKFSLTSKCWSLIEPTYTDELYGIRLPTRLAQRCPDINRVIEDNCGSFGSCLHARGSHAVELAQTIMQHGSSTNDLSCSTIQSSDSMMPCSVSLGEEDAHKHLQVSTNMNLDPSTSFSLRSFSSRGCISAQLLDGVSETTWLGSPFSWNPVFQRIEVIGEIVNGAPVRVISLLLDWDSHASCTTSRQLAHLEEHVQSSYLKHHPPPLFGHTAVVVAAPWSQMIIFGGQNDVFGLNRTMYEYSFRDIWGRLRVRLIAVARVFNFFGVVRRMNEIRRKKRTELRPISVDSVSSDRSFTSVDTELSHTDSHRDEREQSSPRERSSSFYELPVLEEDDIESTHRSPWEHSTAPSNESMTKKTSSNVKSSLKFHSLLRGDHELRRRDRQKTKFQLDSIPHRCKGQDNHMLSRFEYKGHLKSSGSPNPNTTMVHSVNSLTPEDTFCSLNHLRRSCLLAKQFKTKAKSVIEMDATTKSSNTNRIEKVVQHISLVRSDQENDDPTSDCLLFPNHKLAQMLNTINELKETVFIHPNLSAPDKSIGFQNDTLKDRSDSQTLVRESTQLLRRIMDSNVDVHETAELYSRKLRDLFRGRTDSVDLEMYRDIFSKLSLSVVAAYFQKDKRGQRSKKKTSTGSSPNQDDEKLEMLQKLLEEDDILDYLSARSDNASTSKANAIVNSDSESVRSLSRFATERKIFRSCLQTENPHVDGPTDGDIDKKGTLNEVYEMNSERKGLLSTLSGCESNEAYGTLSREEYDFENCQENERTTNLEIACKIMKEQAIRSQHLRNVTTRSENLPERSNTINVIEEGSSNSIRNRSYILREISLYRTEQEEKGDQALQAYYDIKNRQRKSQFSIEMNHGFGAGKDSAERIQVPDLSEAHNTTAAERRLAMLLHLKNRGNVSTRLYAGDPSSPIEQAFRSQQREMRRKSVELKKKLAKGCFRGSLVDSSPYGVLSSNRKQRIDSSLLEDFIDQTGGNQFESKTLDSFNQRRNLRLKYADHASDILSLRRENDKQKTKELLVESDLDFLRCADQDIRLSCGEGNSTPPFPADLRSRNINTGNHGERIQSLSPLKISYRELYKQRERRTSVQERPNHVVSESFHHLHGSTHLLSPSPILEQPSPFTALPREENSSPLQISSRREFMRRRHVPRTDEYEGIGSVSFPERSDPNSLGTASSSTFRDVHRRARDSHL